MSTGWVEGRGGANEISLWFLQYSEKANSECVSTQILPSMPNLVRHECQSQLQETEAQREGDIALTSL